MTATFVKPVTCPRCKGEGMVSSRVVYAGAPGVCFKCAGVGKVEGDKATIAAAKARSAAVTGIIRDTIDALEAAGVSYAKAGRVSYGLDHLATHAPERYEAALVAYQNGHPGLTRAVWAYTAEVGFITRGFRTMSVEEALAHLDAATPAAA